MKPRHVQIPVHLYLANQGLALHVNVCDMQDFAKFAMDCTIWHGTPVVYYMVNNDHVSDVHGWLYTMGLVNDVLRNAGVPIKA